MELPVGIPAGQPVRGAHGQGGLAHAAHAVDGHDPGVPVAAPALVLHVVEELGQFLGAAGEVGQVVGQGARGVGRRGRRSRLFPYRSRRNRALSRSLVRSRGRARSRSLWSALRNRRCGQDRLGLLRNGSHRLGSRRYGQDGHRHRRGHRHGRRRGYRHRHRRGPFGRGQFGAVPQDRLVQPGQPGPRIDPELVHEQLADLPVLPERLGLPPGAVEGEHQLPAQRLPQRVLGDQGPQARDELTALAQGEAQVEQLFRGSQSALLERGRRGLDHRSARPGQHRAAPQREGGPQCVGGRGLPALPHGQGGRPGQGVEFQQVELVVRHHHAVSRPVGGDHRAAGGYPPPQIGDGLADLVRRGHRRVLLPRRLDEPCDGHHPAGFEQQHAQDPFLDGSPQPQPYVVDPSFERSEHVEAQLAPHRSPASSLPGFRIRPRHRTSTPNEQDPWPGHANRIIGVTPSTR